MNATSINPDAPGIIYRFLSGAPNEPGPLAPDLAGWNVSAWFLCSSCAGRIMRRGCALPGTPVPVYRSDVKRGPGSYRACIGCATFGEVERAHKDGALDTAGWQAYCYAFRCAVFKYSRLGLHEGNAFAMAHGLDALPDPDADE